MEKKNNEDFVICPTCKQQVMKLYPETNSARPVSHTNKNGEKCPAGEENQDQDDAKFTLVYTGDCALCGFKALPVIISNELSAEDLVDGEDEGSGEEGVEDSVYFYELKDEKTRDEIARKTLQTVHDAQSTECRGIISVKQVESIEDMEAMMEGDMLEEDVPVKYLN